MPKNVQMNSLLCSSHTLARKCSSSTTNHELPDNQSGFQKGRGTRDQLITYVGSLNKQESSRKNIYFCFIDYAKAFDCVDHNKLWNILQVMGIPDHLTCPWEICMQVKKQQFKMNMEQETVSKLGKEYVKAVYCYPAYLTNMQSTSWEMLDWMKHKLGSRFPGEISITSDTQMTQPLGQKAKKN